MDDLDITSAARTLESLVDDMSVGISCRERYWKAK